MPLEDPPFSFPISHDSASPSPLPPGTTMSPLPPPSPRAKRTLWRTIGDGLLSPPGVGALLFLSFFLWVILRSRDVTVMGVHDETIQNVAMARYGSLIVREQVAL